ncbi:hypothetical protein ACWDRB_47720 [Nonomuraea sp. NPDC003707]
MKADELLRVDLANWPHDRGAGGWVVPHDAERIGWWVVTRVHARYVAPRRTVRRYEPLVRQEVDVVVQPFPLRAYLVDLDADWLPEWELEPMEHVLLHQRPPGSWWYLRHVREDELVEMEKFRQP